MALSIRRITRIYGGNPPVLDGLKWYRAQVKGKGGFAWGMRDNGFVYAGSLVRWCHPSRKLCGTNAMTDELCYLSIAECARRIEARTLSPVDLTNAFLARIEALNPDLHAFLEVTAELALGQARAARGGNHAVGTTRSAARHAVWAQGHL